VHGHASQRHRPRSSIPYFHSAAHCIDTQTGSAHVLRGRISGNSVLDEPSCENPDGTTFFSRFDRFLPFVKQFLAPTPVADGAVVEYVNTADFPSDPGGHYFYTADPAEQAVVDSGIAGRFLRTGQSFNTGGNLPVCRFYGSAFPGPNSHFFTADAGECTFLKGLQRIAIPQDMQQWNYEGTGFNSFLPVAGADASHSCMAGTVPVYRGYNNAFTPEGQKNPWDSNHRFSTNHDAIQGLVGMGWRDEGTVFCAPQ
jgi:hypothetical protein